MCGVTSNRYLPLFPRLIHILLKIFFSCFSDLQISNHYFTLHSNPHRFSSLSFFPRQSHGNLLPLHPFFPFSFSSLLIPALIFHRQPFLHSNLLFRFSLFFSNFLFGPLKERPSTSIFCFTYIHISYLHHSHTQIHTHTHTQGHTHTHLHMDAHNHTQLHTHPLTLKEKYTHILSHTLPHC